MKLVTLYLPETYIKALDRLVDEHFYPNRATAIRTAVRDLIRDEVWMRPPVVEASTPKTEFTVSQTALKEIQKPPNRLVRDYHTHQKGAQQ
jgi:metal-responsive CopG/Arc/MetJ family transcriptional regulator